MPKRNKNAAPDIADPAQSLRAESRRLDGLQALRGIAAVAVALFHTNLLFGAGGIFPANDLGRIFFSFHSGVILFFVLSGFIMLRAHWHDPSRMVVSNRVCAQTSCAHTSFGLGGCDRLATERQPDSDCVWRCKLCSDQHVGLDFFVNVGCVGLQLHAGRIVVAVQRDGVLLNVLVDVFGKDEKVYFFVRLCGTDCTNLQ